MFYESKLTFAAWTGFGITAASIGTAVYQKLSGFGFSNKENSDQANKDELINKLTQDDSEKQKPKEQNIEVRKPDPKEIGDRGEKDSPTDKKEEFSEPKPDQNLNEISQELPKVPDAEEETEENQEEEDQSSDTDEIKHFSLGGNEEDELEEVAKK